MMEYLVTLLNTIFEKHLIPGVLSVIVMILVLFLTPSDNGLILKLGNTFFLVLVFCIAFVVIQFIIFLTNKFRLSGAKRRDSAVYVGRNVIEQLEQMWTYVDALSPLDRKLLDEFLNNDNKPYIENGSVYHSGDTLLTSNLVHRRRVHKEGNDRPIQYAANDLKFAMYEGNSSKTEYVLKEDVFKLLKYSKDKYGRISHFD